jgi:hypothetical protein
MAPGTYSALYTCFDVGSNSGMGLCTSEDAYVLSISTPIKLVADQITNVTVDLDSGTLTVVGIESPGATAAIELVLLAFELPCDESIVIRARFPSPFQSSDVIERGRHKEQR